MFHDKNGLSEYGSAATISWESWLIALEDWDCANFSE